MSYEATLSKGGSALQGHIRRRGPSGSWEYILDVGRYGAQRCQSCGRRFWIELLRTFDRALPVHLVHASRGKFVRAEPASALNDQGRVHHVGTFATMEDQMAGFTPDLDRDTQGSPDRVDALVWAITELMIKHKPQKAATSRALWR